MSSILPGGILQLKDGYLKWNSSLNRLEFSNDGSTYEAIGSGGGVSSSSLVENLGISTSVAANALTVAFKTQAGVDASGSDSIKIAFRSATASNGGYNIRTLTSALSLVVSSGSTLGHQSGVDRYIYVYALDNAGTIKLAVSSAQYDDNSLVTTVAEGGAGAADSNSAMYSDAVYSNVPCRLIGIMISNQATAGTWVSNMSSIEVNPVKLPAIVARVSMSANQTLSNATNTKLNIDTEEVDDKHGLFELANNRIRVNKAGKYRLIGKVMSTADTTTVSLFDCQIWKNNSVLDSSTFFKGSDGNTLTTLITPTINAPFDLAADDYIELYGFQVSGGNFSVLSSAPSQTSYLAIEYLGK